MARIKRKRNRLVAVLCTIAIMAGVLIAGGAAWNGGDGGGTQNAENGWCRDWRERPPNVNPLAREWDRRDCRDWWRHRGTTTTAAPAPVTLPATTVPTPPPGITHYMIFCINVNGNRMEPKRAALDRPALCGHPGRDFHVAVPVTLLPY